MVRTRRWQWLVYSVLGLALVGACQAQTQLYSAEFNTNGNFEGWVDFQNRGGGQVTGGAFRLVVPNSGNLDIQMRSAQGTLGSQNIDVSAYQEVYLEIMIRASIAPDQGAAGASHVSYVGAAANNIAGNPGLGLGTQALPSANTWTHMVWPLKSVVQGRAGSDNILRGIRLDPTAGNGKQGSVVEIDWIRITADEFAPTVDLFTDNFDVSANNWDINFENALRQTGYVSPLNYAEKNTTGPGAGGAHPNFSQVANGGVPGGLFFAGTPGINQPYASPNMNFNIYGNEQKISVDVRPQTFDWGALVFGSASQGTWVVNGDSLGILVRQNGSAQFFDRGTPKLGLPPGSIAVPGGWVHLEISLKHAFDGGTMDLEIRANGVPILSNYNTNDITNNYVTLLMNVAPTGPLRTGGFDNLNITAVNWSPLVPAAATVGESWLVDEQETSLVWAVPVVDDGNEAVMCDVSLLSECGFGWQHIQSLGSYGDGDIIFVEVENLQPGTHYSARLCIRNSMGDQCLTVTGQTLGERPAVVICEQPKDISMKAGRQARFSVNASAEGPMHYQWLLSAPVADVGVGTDSPVLTIDDANELHEGIYYCVISNEAGDSVITEQAKLTIQRLVAHWPLDGDLVDATGNGWDGQYRVLHADAPQEPEFASGRMGQGLSLDLTAWHQSFVEIPGSEGAFNFYDKGFTYSAWVKTWSTTWTGLVSKGIENQRGWMAYMHPAGYIQAKMQPRIRSLFVPKGPRLNDSDWHQFAITYADKHLRVYVDGEFIGAAYHPGPTPASPVPLRFGAANASAWLAMDGRIDHAKLFNYALTPMEAAALFAEK